LYKNVNVPAKKASFGKVLLYFFSGKKSEVESHPLLIEAYGETALSKIAYCDFRCFKSGDFDVEDVLQQAEIG